MTKKTEIDIQKEARRIVGEYTYLDTDFLTLDGWFWEIIRRSDRYIAIIDEIRRACDDVAEPLKQSEGVRRLLGFKYLQEVTDLGIDTPLVPDGSLNEDHYFTFPFNDQHYIGYPYCEVWWPAFGDEEKPVIKGLAPLKWNTYENLKAFMEMMDSFEDSRSVELGKRRKHIVAKIILHGLTPVNAEDTIYCGISRKARKEDVLREIEKVLDQNRLRSKPKIRDDKWPWYLIVYDLHKEGFDDKIIENILSEVFPKFALMFDYVNIKNYREAAIRLINKGLYKKYLK